MISKFYIIKLKKFILPFCFCVFIILLVFFSSSSLASSKSGLALWANSIVPSLFPFLIATELLSHTYVIPILGKVLTPIMRPVFNVPGEGAFALIMGIISGYPIGAKLVCSLYKNGSCTMIEAERLLAFTNNSGPLFIVGSIGISMFGDTRTGILLLIAHILACITVGFIFKFWKSNNKSNSIKTIHYNYNFSYTNLNFSNLGELLGTAIMSSIRTILLVGGFVVLFSVIISMLNKCHIIFLLGKILEPILSIIKIDPCFSSSIITGFIEITNGIKIISNIHIKAISQNIILASFVLGTGGICVLLQVYSIISKFGLSIKPYIIGKVLQAVLAALYTYLFFNCCSFFNLDLI